MYAISEACNKQAFCCVQAPAAFPVAVRMGYITRKLGFMTRQWTAPTVRKHLQIVLDQWCESYEWDQKAALDAGDLVRLRGVKIRAALVSQLLEPYGLKIADRVGVVHIGDVSVHVDLTLAADLGLFSKPWQVTVDDVDAVLEIIKQAGIDREEASSAAVPPAPPPPPMTSMSADEGAASTAAHGLSCRFVILTAGPGESLGVTLGNSNVHVHAEDGPTTPYPAARVTEIAIGGIAALSELLMVGDLVSCVNGRRVHNHQEAVEALSAVPTSSVRFPKGGVRLQVLRATTPATTTTPSMLVEGRRTTTTPAAAAPKSAEASGGTQQSSAGEASSSIRRAMENLKLSVRNVRVRVRGSEPGDALELTLGEAKVVTTDGKWQEMCVIQRSRTQSYSIVRAANVPWSILA